MSFDLGPDDFLIMPTRVHVMRWMGRTDQYPLGSWRLACGSRLSDDTWQQCGWQPSVDEIAEHQLAVCGNCTRTKPQTPDTKEQHQ